MGKGFAKRAEVELIPPKRGNYAYIFNLSNSLSSRNIFSLFQETFRISHYILL